MPTLSLTVNGVPHTLDVAGNRFLAEVLRYELGLTGTKIGCNEAECGACTVIVNGRSVDSCIYPAFKAQNAERAYDRRRGRRVAALCRLQQGTL